MLSRDDVIYGYRFILGRDPESDAVIASQQQSHASLTDFRAALLKSNPATPTADTLSIRFHGHSDRSPLAGLLERAFKKAMVLDSKLPPEILSMPGMSGRRYRRLINNLIGSIPDARYLEIGSWAGSTACAAMFGNPAKITCIDNWSQFGGPRDRFLANVAKYKDELTDFHFIEADFRSVSFADVGKYNVYLFDGPHGPRDQFDGAIIALGALESEYIFIVDDWNWSHTRDGTLAGLASRGLDLVYAIEIKTSQDGTHPEIKEQHSDWHNGYYLAVIRQPIKQSESMNATTVPRGEQHTGYEEITEARLVEILQHQAAWSGIGAPEKPAPLPIVMATGRNSIPALSNAIQPFCFRVDIVLDNMCPTRFEISANNLEQLSRPIAGAAVVEFLLRHYILSEYRFHDLACDFQLEHGQRLTAYGQVGDRTISLANCVAFGRPRGDRLLTLLPDLYFCGSLAYHELRYSTITEAKPWNERKSKAFWRGSTTGLLNGVPLIYEYNMTELPRLRLCEIGSHSPNIMDCGITKIVQAADPETAVALSRYCEVKGMLRPFVPLEQMAGYKLLVDIDGNVNSWGLIGKLKLGSCILKVDSAWEQWFYSDLEPWKHYVPVRADLGDLIEKVRWCMDNDGEARAIGQAGADFASARTFDTEMAAASRRLLNCLVV